MKHTEQEAIVIAQNYKKKYSNLNNNIKRAEFHDKYNVKGDKAWVVISEFELFGDIEDFYYVISDETGEVEYTFNEHGSINPHILVQITDKDFLCEWDEYEKEHPEDFI